MAKQFNSVSCKYGAPMGRATYGIASDHAGAIRLFRVRMVDGGYDDGGAYWGYPADLYCARDAHDEYREFTRASSREEACDNLGIPVTWLARGFPKKLPLVSIAGQ